VWHLGVVLIDVERLLAGCGRGSLPCLLALPPSKSQPTCSAALVATSSWKTPPFVTRSTFSDVARAGDGWALVTDFASYSPRRCHPRGESPSCWYNPRRSSNGIELAIDCSDDTGPSPGIILA